MSDIDDLIAAIEGFGERQDWTGLEKTVADFAGSTPDEIGLARQKIKQHIRPEFQMDQMEPAARRNEALRRAFDSLTARERLFQPSLRQYNPPTLQQPPQPWLDQSDTPLPLRLSEEQGPSTVTGGEGSPIIPPSDWATPGSPPDPHPGRGAAALSAVGSLTVAETAALSGAAALSAVGGFNVQAATLQPSTSLTILPTIYPMPPDDTVTVEDPVFIDVRSTDFRDFAIKVDRLIEAIQQSNEIGQETRRQIVAELNAGVEYIKASKPSRKVLTLLLIVPLTAVATVAANTVVQEAAKVTFRALLKLISPDVDIPL